MAEPKFNLDDFLIDRIRRGTMFSDTTGEVLWSITQINDATLSMTSETADVTDAIGNIITQFDRSKNAEFSGSNALWNLGLAAAQAGTEKKVATGTSKITAPIYEQLSSTEHVLTLSKTPKGTNVDAIKYIYKLNSDSTLSTKYTVTESDPQEEGENGPQFMLDISNKKITLPEDTPNDTLFAVFYEYESDATVMIESNASDFPKAGKFVLEVLGKSVCDKTAVYSAYIVFPNAKLKSDYDLSFTSDGGHPFTLQMMQDYCDPQKLLYRVYISN